MIPWVQPAGAGIDGIVWHIVGQTYTPLQRAEHSMAWHAVMPPGTFVPPHVHPTQDEFVYMLSGTMEMDHAGATTRAGVGDLVCLPMGEPHGLFNRTAETLSCLFWVAPTRLLWDLFVALDGVGDPAEVARLASLHEVHFLP